MEGSITERQDPDGRIRRKGEMKLAHRKYCINLQLKYYIYTHSMVRCQAYIITL